jgi:hypothetical protein
MKKRSLGAAAFYRHFAPTGQLVEHDACSVAEIRKLGVNRE